MQNRTFLIASVGAGILGATFTGVGLGHYMGEWNTCYDNAALGKAIPARQLQTVDLTGFTGAAGGAAGTVAGTGVAVTTGGAANIAADLANKMISSSQALLEDACDTAYMGEMIAFNVLAGLSLIASAVMSVLFFKNRERKLFLWIAIGLFVLGATFMGVGLGHYMGEWNTCYDNAALGKAIPARQLQNVDLTGFTGAAGGATVTVAGTGVAATTGGAANIAADLANKMVSSSQALLEDACDTAYMGEMIAFLVLGSLSLVAAIVLFVMWFLRRNNAAEEEVKRASGPCDRV